MKARVKATDIVLDVYPSHIIRDNVKEIIWYKTPQGACLTKDELEFIDTENNFDYWTRLEHQSVIGIYCANLAKYGCILSFKNVFDEAHALVEKMKEERK